MIKLSANVSKKVPVPDVEFSSQSYSAGMEVELSSGTSKEEVEQKLRALYALLEESINQQIRDRKENSKGGNSPKADAKQGQKNYPKGNNSNTSRRATKAQLRAIHAIAKDQGYPDEELKSLVSETCGVDSTSALSIGQASALIDTLKNNGKE